MPEISRFFGIIVAMFYDEHNPPHFHARYGDAQAAIEIATLRGWKEAFRPRLGSRHRMGFTASRSTDAGLATRERREAAGEDCAAYLRGPDHASRCRIGYVQRRLPDRATFGWRTWSRRLLVVS